MRPSVRCVAATAVLAAAASSGAEVVYQTDDPFGGFLGINGMDVFENQSVAVRFTPDADFELTEIRPWFMNNDSSGNHFGLVRLSLQTDQSDGDISIPSGKIIESWEFNISSIGWDPLEESVQSVLRPLLQAGVNYWVVAECDDPAFIDPVWCFAGIGSGFMSNTSFSDEWQPGGFGAVVSITVEGDRVVHHYDLEVSDLTGGQPGTFAVTGARPNTNAYLAYSLSGPGSTYVPPLGVTLGIGNPSPVGGPSMADANGDAQWTINVPRRASGRTIWFQSAQMGALSDVVSVPVN